MTTMLCYGFNYSEDELQPYYQDDCILNTIPNKMTLGDWLKICETFHNIQQKYLLHPQTIKSFLQIIADEYQLRIYICHQIVCNDKFQIDPYGYSEWRCVQYQVDCDLCKNMMVDHEYTNNDYCNSIFGVVLKNIK